MSEHARAPVARLILASASPARARVLEHAGITFEVMVSDVDEDAVVASARARGEDLTCAGTATLLARAKAQDVATRDEAAGALVLGCDSVFELDGTPYGKPYEVEVAVERWRQMRGRTGTLHTGHWMISAGDRGADTDDGAGARAGAGRTVSTQVSFAEPTETQVRAYAESGEPLLCAGAFTIDGRGAAFVREVTGDHLSVIGVSPHAVGQLLVDLDVDITDLWRTTRG